jgi:DNA-binding CsgD family transcriptional regulator
VHKPAPSAASVNEWEFHVATSSGEWDACIDRLYEAVGNEALLTTALGAFRPFFDARSVSFMTAPLAESSMSIHVAACDVPPASLVEYHSHYFRHDEWVKAGFAAGNMRQGVIYRGSDLVPRRTLLRTYFWHDFLSRYSISDILGTVVDEPSERGPAAYVTFHRLTDQRPFEVRMLTIMAKLAPHLKRAWRLHFRLAPRISMGATLSELFHAMDVPMLFVSFEGAVVEHNAAALKMIESDSTLLRIDRNALAYCDGRSWRPIAAELERFVSGSSPVFELRARDVLGSAAATVTLRRMHSAFTDKLVRHARAVVCTVTPAAIDKLHYSIQRFGLTNAEHQVAQALAQGHSVTDIARDQGVAVSTVRTHLSALFSKTGTQRQAELVAMLLKA